MSTIFNFFSRSLNKLENSISWISDEVLRRLLCNYIPKEWQHKLRDSGIIKILNDFVAIFAGVFILTIRPRCLVDFLYWQTHKSIHHLEHLCQNAVSKKSKKYDSYIESLRLEDSESNIEYSSAKSIYSNCTLLFVHGGAWGSGRLWQYCLPALQAARLLKASEVAMLRYPYYPEANILQQKDSVLKAIKYLQSVESSSSLNCSNDSLSKRKIVLCGHSSGANICMLALLQQLREDPKKHTGIDLLIGLAGVYDIESHYQFESTRGVHELSPMKAAAGNEELFWQCSPTILLQKFFPAEFEFHQQIKMPLPCISLIHGVSDKTVPDSSSKCLETQLKRVGIPVEGHYIKGGHLDPVLDLIFRGDNATTKAILDSVNSFDGSIC